VHELLPEVESSAAVFLASLGETVTKIPVAINVSCRACEYRLEAAGATTVDPPPQNGFVECWGKLAEEIVTLLAENRSQLSEVSSPWSCGQKSESQTHSPGRANWGSCGSAGPHSACSSPVNFAVLETMVSICFSRLAQARFIAAFSRVRSACIC